MTIIAMPASARIRRVQWTLDRPTQVNRSAYTGVRRVVANPWHGKWSARVEVVPLLGEVSARSWRAFFAKLKGQVNTFLLPATEGPQHSLGTGTASGSAAQGATSIALAASPTYGPELVANGDFASGTTGWTPNAATLAISGGQLQITATASPGAGASQSLTGLTVGATYRLSVGWMNNGANYALVEIQNPVGPTSVLKLDQGTYGNSAAATFVATNTTHTVICEVSSNAAWGPSGTVSTFDNISVKLQTGTGTPPLTAGMMATVTLPSGNKQLVMLTADISGSTISFEPPLREAISSGAAVDHLNPACHVALAASDFTWSVDPGTQYGISFDAEEAF